MDRLIGKKGEGAVGGYSTRCYRLRNCELMQYKKGIDDFQLCTDKSLKRRYNIYNIESISIGHSKEPYILSLSYNEETCLDLKFNDEKKNKKQKISHAEFCCWYRIICASSRIPYNYTCKERPLPSNICYTLYYLLQKLYHHSEVLNTKYIFQKSLQRSSSNKHIQKLYYNLMVNGRKFSNDLINNSNNNQINNQMDIYLLSKTLIYTLQNMPTSLLCDNNCSQLTIFVYDILEKAVDITNNNSNAINNIPQYEDIEIYSIKNNKQALKEIKEKLLEIYSNDRKEYKKQNGFDLFNRYGFMTILFLLLSNISSNEYYKYTSMNAEQLAIQFNDALQSKQYLYHCRTELLINKSSSKSSTYEQQFIKMLKILIYFAHDLFPDLSRIKWKIKNLVIAQATEKLMVKKYNDNFSRDTKNKYYIASILRNSINYGYFDGKYYDINNDKSKQKYEVKRVSSYNQMPAFNSDIGIDDDDDKSSSQSPHIIQKITFNDNNEDYKQDDEKETSFSQENDYNLNYNEINGSSWLADCEICLYAPIMSMFSNGNNTEYYNNV